MLQLNVSNSLRLISTSFVDKKVFVANFFTKTLETLVELKRFYFKIYTYNTEYYRRYNPESDQWTTITSLPMARDAVGVCSIANKLYACGGYDGNIFV